MGRMLTVWRQAAAVTHGWFCGVCRDLQEVCEAQLQFAPKAALPIFGGTRGPEITKSITDIQVQAQRWPDHLPGKLQISALHLC